MSNQNDSSGEHGHEWYSEPDGLIFQQWWDEAGRHKVLMTPKLANAQQARVTAQEAELQDWRSGSSSAKRQQFDGLVARITALEHDNGQYVKMLADDEEILDALHAQVAALTAAGKALEDELHADPAYEERIRRRRQQHSKDFQQLEAQVIELQQERDSLRIIRTDLLTDALTRAEVAEAQVESLTQRIAEVETAWESLTRQLKEQKT